jgi:predicted outer membrane repeat protein
VYIFEGNYTGDKNRYIDINKSINITGASQTDTIIDAQNKEWVFSIYSRYGVTVTIKQLTIANVLSVSNVPGFPVGGGAIHNYGGTVTVADSTFINNRLTGVNIYGGAIFNEKGTMTVTGSTFTGNSANSGGAIYNEDTMTVTGSTFTDNNARDDGGAISNYRGTLTVNSSTFTGNRASKGGAISNLLDSTLIVTGSNFNGNTAYYGGGIGNDGTMTVTGSTFTGNKAENGGSGGAIQSNAISTVNFNRFLGNTAEGGEGDAIYVSSGAMNAKNNWWGSSNPNFTKLVYGNVDYTPWLTSDPVQSGAIDDPGSTAEAAGTTVPMQPTGLPVNYLVLALLMVIGGFLIPKRK